MYFYLILYWILDSLATIVPIIISVAFYTLAERKLMAYLQRRVGPNVVGVFGLLQPVSDGLKLLLKESILVRKSTPFIYSMACAFPFVFSMLNWYNIPFNEVSDMSNLSSLNLLYIFPISMGSLAGVVLSGWASNSKYSVIGAYRGLAQLISYDIPMIFSILPILLFTGSLDLIDIAYNQTKNVWFFFVSFISFFIFSITVLAETNRVPFDLPEAEAELVAGFNVEYSSINFALFFLGEYSSMLLLSGLISLLFFSGQSKQNISIFILLIFLYFVIKKLASINYLNFIYFFSNFFYDNNWQEQIQINYFFKVCLNFVISFISLCIFIPRVVFIWKNSYALCFIFRIFNYFLFPGLLLPFSFKIILVGFLFILVRANVPRYRFDQLLGISWKGLIPLSICSFIFSFSLLYVFNGFILII